MGEGDGKEAPYIGSVDAGEVWHVKGLAKFEDSEKQHVPVSAQYSDTADSKLISIKIEIDIGEPKPKVSKYAIPKLMPLYKSSTSAIDAKRTTTVTIKEVDLLTPATERLSPTYSNSKIPPNDNVCDASPQNPRLSKESDQYELAMTTT
jgi:hypothetical protein